MSSKLKFSLYSAFTMSLLSVAMRYFIFGFISLMMFSALNAPASLIHKILGLPHLTGDNPLYYQIISFVLFFIVGLLWGFVLYYIRSRDSQQEVKFGLGAFVTTVVVQFGLAYLITYVLAFIFNFLKFGHLGIF